MVSLWPWKSDSSSPESFEKALSALSGKITTTTGQLESQRQIGRRLKALWTLYTSIAYLLYVMIVTLVVGWKNWAAPEYTALAGSPVFIYTGRRLITTFYDYRISSTQAYLSSLQKERDRTIAKLKAATKYDSTQQLLEKYGGTPAKPKQKSQESRNSGQDSANEKPRQPQSRTRFEPPPTANIPGRNPSQAQADPGLSGNAQQLSNRLQSPQNGTGSVYTPSSTLQLQHEMSPQDQAEFAPNAYPAQYYIQPDGTRWYDRLMDVLLGEDEMNPKNRLALICRSCRLVNGQAPPGLRQLEDVGTWRCSGCGTLNGEASETNKLMVQINGNAQSDTQNTEGNLIPTGDIIEADEVDMVGDAQESDGSDVTHYTDEEITDVKLQTSSEPDLVEDKPKRGRGRPRGSGSKKA